MGVVKVTERPERHADFALQRNNLLHEIVGRKYTKRFNVWTDTYRIGPREIAASPMLPQLGSQYQHFYETDALATCVRVTPIATSNKKFWYVDAEFDTDRIVALVTDNPLNQPPDINWDFVDEDRPMVNDSYGTPVLTSAQHAFDPPLTYPLKCPVLKITRNEATYSPGYARQFTSSLNLLPFAGAEPLYARMDYFTGHKQISNGVIYYQVNYSITFLDLSHVLYILDKDFRDIDGKLFLDPLTGTALSNETLLNGRGKKLSTATSTLQSAITDSATTIVIAAGDVVKFPPALMPARDGITPGPYWNYKIRIEDEIVNVVGGHGTDTLTVQRGSGNTVAAAHANATSVKLEPYYLRFIPPPGPKDWTDLALPVI